MAGDENRCNVQGCSNEVQFVSNAMLHSQGCSLTMQYVQDSSILSGNVSAMSRDDLEKWATTVAFAAYVAGYSYARDLKVSDAVKEIQNLCVENPERALVDLLRD